MLLVIPSPIFNFVVDANTLSTITPLINLLKEPIDRHVAMTSIQARMPELTEPRTEGRASNVASSPVYIFTTGSILVLHLRQVDKTH